MGGISNKAQIQVLALSYTILLHFARYIHFPIQMITFSLGGVLLRFCGRRGIVELGTKMGPSWPLDRPHSVPSGQLFFRRGVAKCFLWHGPVRKRYRFNVYLVNWLHRSWDLAPVKITYAHHEQDTRGTCSPAVQHVWSCR